MTDCDPKTTISRVAAAIFLLALLPSQGHAQAGGLWVEPTPPATLTHHEEKCAANALSIQVGEGGKITGPVTITRSVGQETRPNGDTYALEQDTITVSPGQTVIGPAKLCTRTVGERHD